MAGRTLFFKFNTGPSGHGSPAARRRGRRAQARGRDRREGVRVRGRGRPHHRRDARVQELRVGPRPRQPRLHPRLERLRHRPEPVLVGRARDARRSGSSRTAGRPAARRTAASSNRSRAPCTTSVHAEPRQAPEVRLGQDAQGPRLRRLRLQVARHRAQAQQRALLADEEGVRRQVRRHVRLVRPAGPERLQGGAPPGGGQPRARARRPPRTTRRSSST